MKRLLLAFCVLLGTQMLSAQIISSKQVTVRTVQPVERVYQHDIEKGYRGFVEGAFAIGFGDNGLGFDVLTTHGYQFNHVVFVGGGIGLKGLKTYLPYYAAEDYQEYYYGVHFHQTYNRPSDHNEDTYGYKMLYSIPLYANFRLYMSRTKVKPYLDFKLGGMIALHSNEREARMADTSIKYGDYEEYSTDDYYPLHRVEVRNSGYYALLGLGVEYKLYAWSINFDFSGMHGKFDTGDKGFVGHNIGMNFNFGVNF